jgi:serine/threonine protein kinase
LTFVEKLTKYATKLKDYFRKLFRKEQKPPDGWKHPEAVRQEMQHQNEIRFYKRGDLIGRKYEIRDVLGEGGFGIVYLTVDCETKELCALKTFRDDFLTSASARQAFKDETLLWIGLESHPFILAARWVLEFSGLALPRFGGQVSGDCVS